jgi:hypothetical protein
MMTETGGDIRILYHAAELNRLVARDINGLADAIAATGTRAREAIDHPDLAATVADVLGTVARATGDTALIVSRLEDVTRITGASLARAGGTS